MELTGLTADVHVADLREARPFYEWLLGREADLTPSPDMLEWILLDVPQIALRVVESHGTAGTARVGIGVDDVEQQHARLAQARAVPDVRVIPNVIALLELIDDDGNEIVYWQDLLGTAGTQSEAACDAPGPPAPCRPDRRVLTQRLPPTVSRPVR